MSLFDFVEKCYEKYGDGKPFEEYICDFMNSNFHVEAWHELFGNSNYENCLGCGFWFNYEVDIENRQIIFPIISDTEGVLD